MCGSLRVPFNMMSTQLMFFLLNLVPSHTHTHTIMLTLILTVFSIKKKPVVVKGFKKDRDINMTSFLSSSSDDSLSFIGSSLSKMNRSRDMFTQTWSLKQVYSNSRIM